MDRMVALEHGSCEHLPTTSVKQLRSDSCLTLKYLTPENSSHLTPQMSEVLFVLGSASTANGLHGCAGAWLVQTFTYYISEAAME